MKLGPTKTINEFFAVHFLSWADSGHYN